MTIEEKNYINLLEKIGSNVHPALEQQIVDGWICNFAEGYSRRANSVLAFDWRKSSEESIKTCESLYAKAGLPCIFKMPFSRHWIMHVEAMQKIKNKLCKEALKR